MNFKKINPGIIAIVLLAVIFVLSLCIRTALPAEKIFSDVGIKYSSADAYYNMRQVDNLASNYPDHTEIDPYLVYPGVIGKIYIRFFAWLIATISWIIGLGAPTQHIIDLVGVYTPAILGALTVIPVFIIGKELFGRWAGIISALLIAIIPGEFLGRSILGFTDYHIAESFFTALTLMFLILAIKRASERQITFDTIKQVDWSVIRRPLIYSLLGGFFLALYIYTWTGALLFVFIIFLYFIIQFIIDHLRKKSTEYLCFVSVPFFLVALIMSLFVGYLQKTHYASLAIALVIPIALGSISWYFTRKSIKPTYYPLTIFGLGLAGLGLFYLISPTLVSAMLNSLANLIPRGAHITTIEMQPLISRNYVLQYGSMFSVVYGNYPGLIPIKQSTAGVTFINVMSFITTNFFYSLISLCLLIYVVIKRGESGKTLLVIWSLIILVCNLIQRRFGYYYAVNVALLVGYLVVEVPPLIAYGVWWIFGLGGSRTSISGSESKEVKENEVADKKDKPDKSDSFKDARYAIMAVSIIVILAMIITQNDIKIAVNTAKEARYAPRDAWINSLEWMKENTPEPFGNPDSYYQTFEYPPEGEEFEYPESIYGVLSWWDYGYWITRIGHRLPTANPGQDPDAIKTVASFFTSQDEESAIEIIDEVNVKYVIIDYETAFNKFHAVAEWSEEDIAEYFEFYIWQEGDNWVYRPRYYPKYYRSLVARLYCFDGEAVISDNVTVISFQNVSDGLGNVFKQITSETEFATFEEAEAYVSSQESPNYKIASKSPFDSPVSLEKLEYYRLVHGSDNKIGTSSGDIMSEVKIYEYIK